MIRQCCVCHRIDREGEWVEAGVIDFKRCEVTHGYCDSCLEELKRSILEYEELRGTPALSAAAA